MHNRVFHSLQELNDAVAGLLEQYNSRRMQGCDYSRVERFLAVEKPELLSAQRYQMKRHALLTIAPNSFIQLGRERHHYSVPSRLIANKVEVIFTDTQVRIFHSGTCVATHMRSFKQGGYTWVKEHLPSQSLLCLYMTTSEDHKHTSDISYQLLKRHINGKSLSDLKAIRLPSMARTWQNLMEAHRTDSISLTDGMRLLIQGENDMRMSNRTHRLIKNSTI